MSNALLSIQELEVAFTTEDGFTKAVNGISFSIGKGETVAVVGESGSGKSVTSLTALRLLPQPPATYPKGSILFTRKDGTTIDLLHASPSQLQTIRGNEIAMIFQEPMTSLNPVFTCGAQVMEAIQLHQKLHKEEARLRTLALFEKVKLPNPEAMLQRYPHQLSGGQKQRVMIAMAMSCNPSLLIADEPTTALDVTVQNTILQLIKELQQETGMGVLFITHDLAVVHDIADRIVVMYKGEVVEQGATAEIFQNPQHPYTKALLACRPALHPKGKRLPVVSDFLEVESKADSHQPIAISKKNAESSTPLLQIQHLNVWFPEQKKLFGKPTSFIKAVNNVSFDVFAGETVGLVGESGCGKTTLGRAILRLVDATSGSIVLNGEDILQKNAAAFKPQRKDLQIVFQDPYSSLNPRISIGDAITEPMLVHCLAASKKQAKERTIDLLEKVNLTADHFKRYPHEFSGGQRQRIVIARALALHPSFIVWDESVSALDVSVQAQVLNLLNDLKQEFNFTSIFISHDLAVVRYICDRIIVMNKGEIEESGSADDIYFNPQQAYTRQLLEAIPGRGL
ncbi:peptide/nickel transport system ATP-binding protein [Lacibacter cauensis]|uniref:Peptide/nickel transport system ATP-binding protein n=1 Tax=Lacibacter cauensis TaxID=510947 RepID=A0A562SG06_9BACT|nr:ABC transporter ATP-binding protein [Lacibacter cauensis]TWI80287.1 peptide/nickel transport system ATP-binding protein [Lacibacter cauensis]